MQRTELQLTLKLMPLRYVILSTFCNTHRFFRNMVSARGALWLCPVKLLYIENVIAHIADNAGGTILYCRGTQT